MSAEVGPEGWFMFFILSLVCRLKNSIGINISSQKKGTELVGASENEGELEHDHEEYAPVLLGNNY